MARRIVLAAALAAFSTMGLAQTAEQLEQEARKALAAKDYGTAAVLLERAFESDRTAPAALYNAAAYHALAGNVDKALRTLQLAVENGYLNGAQAENDADLKSLHADPRWPALIAMMKARQALEAKLYESPALASPYRENLSEDEKVAGLSKFWSEVKYNFVYVDTLKALDWDKLYLEYLPKVRATRSTTEYYKVLIALCARLKDGHTNVYPGPELRNIMMAGPLMSTDLVEGRVLVRAVFDPALVAAGVAPGVEITEVDGEPVRAYAERELVPYQSASTPQDMDRRAYGYAFLSGPIDVAPRVTFRTAAGKRFVAAARRVDWGTWAKARPRRPAFEMRMLPGNVAYVALNGFGDQQAADGFIAAFDKIAQSSALVIDMRNNGGGNSDVGYRVLATLTDKPFRTAKWGTRNYRPSYRAWQRTMPNYEEDEAAWQADTSRQYTKPVAVLTSGATYSAGEDFMVAFDTMKRGLIVGEPTGGSTGQPLMIALPGGGMARICTKADTYPDGRVWVGKGIQPHLKVAPTVADLRKGKDTVLEAALAALRK
jgi:carboxyl-terminal processing protease